MLLLVICGKNTKFSLLWGYYERVRHSFVRQNDIKQSLEAYSDQIMGSQLANVKT